jgi:hypothetical protein
MQQLGSCAKLSNQNQVSNRPQGQNTALCKPFSLILLKVRDGRKNDHCGMSVGCRTDLCTTFWELEMARPTNTTNCCHHARSCSLLCIFCKVKAMVLCDGSCPQRPDNSDGNDAIRLSRVAACLSCPTERDRRQCPPQSATIISMVRCIYIACCVNKCL